MTDLEDRLDLLAKRKELEDLDNVRDSQRRMAWFAISGMLFYPACIMIAELSGLATAAQIIGDIAPTYFVSVAAIVMAFYGVNAYRFRNNNDWSKVKVDRDPYADV